MALSLCFNRPGTSFVVAHDAGFSVYDAQQGTDYQIDLPQLGFPVRCAAMIDQHPYVVVAKHLSEEVELWDCRTKTKVHTYCSMPNKQVRALLATKERVVMVCAASTVIFDCEDATRLAEHETTANELGLCGLGGSRIALPGRSLGQVQVVDLGDGKVRHVFPAHRSGLSAIEVSSDARYVATSGEDGTIFRIWALPERALVKQLRRGLDRAAIFSIRMSPDNTFLAATSGNGTLHVFTLAQQPVEEEGGAEDSSSYGGNGIGKGMVTPAAPAATAPKGRTVMAPSRTSEEKASDDAARAAGFHVVEPASKEYLPSILADPPPDDYDLIDEVPASAPNSKQPAGPKFGVLGKLPFAPTILTDQYSNATMKYDMGPISASGGASWRDRRSGGGGAFSSSQETPGRHRQGQIQWVDEATLVVVRVRPGVVWEKFRVRNAVEEWKLERITSRGLVL